MKKTIIPIFLLFISIANAQSPVLLVDAEPTSLDGLGHSFTELNGKTIFVTQHLLGYEFKLWSTDGTPTGTQKIRDFKATGNYTIGSPNNLTAFNNNLIFIAGDSVFGNELWITDGTAAGTKMLKDIYPSYTKSSNPTNFIQFQNKLFFSATDSAFGQELWVTDGTKSGTKLFKDINPGTASAFTSNHTLFNNKLYFAANNGTNGAELWVSDGTDTGTKMFFDVNPGPEGSNPFSFFVSKNKLYFQAWDNANGIAIWVTDGTSTGTQLLKDINPSKNFIPHIGAFTEFNNMIYFFADDGTNGSELWITNGTSSGTQLFKDINSNPLASSGPAKLFIYKNKMYFAANDGINGNEIWVTDGTLAGTEMYLDVNETPGKGSNPSVFIIYHNKLYFVASNTYINSPFNYQLYETDGIKTNTKIIKPLNDSTISPLYKLVSSLYCSMNVCNGSLFFPASYGKVGTEPHVFTTANPNSNIAWLTSKNSFELFPNPANDQFTMQSDQIMEQIKIFNLSGHEVYKNSCFSKLTSINIPSLENGIYFVESKIDEEIVTRKLIVQH